MAKCSTLNVLSRLETIHDPEKSLNISGPRQKNQENDGNLRMSGSENKVILSLRNSFCHTSLSW